MYHYTTSSSLSPIGIREEAKSVQVSTHLAVRRSSNNILHRWRDYIPTQAIQHSFLMHGILAFSALHLAYLHRYKSAQYLQLCDKHQAVALKKFRTILSSDIDPEMADSLFALASIISVSSMARSCAAAEATAGPGTMDMNDVTELFFLVRGVRDVIQATHDHVIQGPMAAVFHAHRMPEGTNATFPDEVDFQFNALRQMLATWGLDPEALTHCQTALTYLEDIYQNIMYFGPRGQIETGQIFRWKIAVPVEYIRLVQARCQPALVIFAYYAAAATADRTQWYTQHWGEYAIRGVSLELDEEMLRWMEWPMRQVTERMAILGVQLPREEESGAKSLVGFGDETWR